MSIKEQVLFSINDILNNLLSLSKGCIIKSKIVDDQINGFYGNKFFTIQYVGNEFLSVKTSDEEVLNKLVYILEMILSDRMLCRYTLVDSGKKTFVSEWDSMPYTRAGELLKDQRQYQDLAIEERYLPQQYRLLKIPGLSPGWASHFIDLNNLEEIYLFLAIAQHLDDLDVYMQRFPWYNDSYRLEVLYQYNQSLRMETLHFLITRLQNFGVDITSYDIMFSMDVPKSLEEWYDNWKKNVLNKLSNQDLGNLLLNYFRHLPLPSTSREAFKKMSKTNEKLVKKVPNNIIDINALGKQMG